MRSTLARYGASFLSLGLIYTSDNIGVNVLLERKRGMGQVS